MAQRHNAWVLQSLLKQLVGNRDKIITSIGKPSRLLWLLACIALGIKLLLQMISVVPSLSTFRVGFRPIVVSYLHLVLLGVITLFIIGFMFINHFINLNKLCRYGTIVFVSGIVINEALLMAQGITGMSYKSIPYINEMLFGAAIIMFGGY